MILLVRAATLPGYVDGVMFYLTPQWDKLADINVSTTHNTAVGEMKGTRM